MVRGRIILRDVFPAVLAHGHHAGLISVTPSAYSAIAVFQFYYF
jgi:hypothetical protein